MNSKRVCVLACVGVAVYSFRNTLKNWMTSFLYTDVRLNMWYIKTVPNKRTGVTYFCSRKHSETLKENSERQSGSGTFSLYKHANMKFSICRFAFSYKPIVSVCLSRPLYRKKTLKQVSRKFLYTVFPPSPLFIFLFI